MKTTRKLFALVLCMCMVLSCMPAMQAAAAEVVSNEPFEIYNENSEPKGWEITSLSDNGLDEAGADWAGSYSFGIVEEADGNKAIAINKNAIGYGALVTPAVTVTEGTNYRLSFAYRNAYTGIVEGEEEYDAFWGMRITVHFYDANGEELTSAYKTVNHNVVGSKVSETWTQMTYDFTPVEGAATAKVFFGLGGEKYAIAQMLIDDYSVTAYAPNVVANSDFNGIVNEAAGARPISVSGPGLWTVKSVNIGGDTFNSDGYESKYVVSTVVENGNAVMELKPNTSVMGYAVAHSNYIKAESGATYTLKYDQKTTGSDIDGSGTPYRGARVFLYYYDAQMNLLGNRYQPQSAVLTAQDWTTKTFTTAAIEGTAYIGIGFYIGGQWGTSGDFAYYYDNVSLTKVAFNGDFESVDPSNAPFSWTKTSMTASSKIETENNWAANYTLTTAAGQGIDGSNAASLTKNGVGYAALTSLPVPVLAGKNYRVSYAYKTTAITGAQNVSDYYGIHTAVQCLDADGNQVDWILLNDTGNGKGQTVSDAWENANHDFVAPEGTAQIRVYLSTGGIYYVKATTLFDNVSVIEYASNAIVNADFEGTVNKVVGGRNGSTEGPSGWTIVSTNGGGEWNSATTDWLSNYAVTTLTLDDGNKVMKLAPCTSSTGTRGYIVAYSQPVAVEAATPYTLSFDQKVDVGEPTYDAKILFYYFDENMEFLGGDWKRSSGVEHDWQNMSVSVTTRDKAAYVIVGLYIGGGWDQNAGIAYYYDNLDLHISTYKVTYVADGVTVAEFTVKHGEDVPANVKIPEKDGNIGMWDHNGTNITADTVITANYTDLTQSPLWLKSALFSGDSICHASDRVGWAGRIGEKYAMAYVNAGVSGASVSTVRDARMIDQIKKHKDNNYDFVILHGGVNDAWSKATIGEMTDSYALSQFDVDSFAGALEELFYYAKLYYGDAKFGYIINFRFAEDNTNGYLADMTEYVEMIKNICDKWDIPYLDLYNNEELNAALDVNSPDNFTDGIHPNAAGYDIITPYIEAWMNDVVAVYEADTIPVANDIELWNITLSDNIGANFYVTANDAANTSVKVTFAGNENTIQLADKNADGYYVISVNAAAAQMTDEIKVEIVVNSESVKTGTYSVYEYAQYILAGEYSAETKSLVKEMLNYGTAAQNYFNYNLENKIDETLIADAGAKEIDGSNVADMVIDGSADGIRFYGASLVFESKVAVRFYFTIEGDINNYTFSTGNAPVLKDGLYYVEIADINPQAYADVITLIVNDTLTISYSPMNYMVRKSANGSDNLKALLKAMYNYHLAAVDYVN